MTFKRALLATSAATLFVTGFAQMAAAQIEEIVVTARKREESLQDVPLSMQVIGSAALEHLFGDFNR